MHNNTNLDATLVAWQRYAYPHKTACHGPLSLQSLYTGK
ncbi:hypothetical protein P3T23_000709 [Paraburkholderia sp. GAS448]